MEYCRPTEFSVIQNILLNILAILIVHPHLDPHFYCEIHTRTLVEKKLANVQYPYFDCQSFTAAKKLFVRQRNLKWASLASRLPLNIQYESKEGSYWGLWLISLCSNNLISYAVCQLDQVLPFLFPITY